MKSWLRKSMFGRKISGVQVGLLEAKRGEFNVWGMMSYTRRDIKSGKLNRQLIRIKVSH